MCHYQCVYVLSVILFILLSLLSKCCMFMIAEFCILLVFENVILCFSFVLVIICLGLFVGKRSLIVLFFIPVFAHFRQRVCLLDSSVSRFSLNNPLSKLFFSATFENDFWVLSRSIFVPGKFNNILKHLYSHLRNNENI